MGFMAALVQVVPLVPLVSIHDGVGIMWDWSAPWKGQHINILELRAVDLALWRFAWEGEPGGRPALQGNGGCTWRW